MQLHNSLAHVDPVTLKSNYNTERFRKVFQLYKDLYSIPGQMNAKGEVTWASAGFFNNKNVAMYTGPLNIPRMIESLNDSLVWDVTFIFNFEEARGTERSMDLHALMMSSTSKNKDAAFQVLAMVASDEFQMEMARNVRVPAALEYDQFKTIYSDNQSKLKIKNWAGVFKATPRENAPQTPYQSAASKVFNTAASRLAKDQVDVNTLMRELQEKADAAIETEKRK